MRPLRSLGLQVKQFSEHVKGKPPAPLAVAEQQFAKVIRQLIRRRPELRQAVHDVRMSPGGGQRLEPGRKPGEPYVGLVREEAALWRPSSVSRDVRWRHRRRGQSSRGGGLPAGQVAGLKTGIGRACHLSIFALTPPPPFTEAPFMRGGRAGC